MLFGKYSTVPLASWSMLVTSYPIINSLVECCIGDTELLGKTSNWELWLVFWPVWKPLSFVSTNYMHLKLHLMVQFTRWRLSFASLLSPTCNTKPFHLIPDPPAKCCVVMTFPVLVTYLSHPKLVCRTIKSVTYDLIRYNMHQYRSRTTCH